MPTDDLVRCVFSVYDFGSRQKIFYIFILIFIFILF
jgi:hypothetical protein